MGLQRSVWSFFGLSAWEWLVVQGVELRPNIKMIRFSLEIIKYWTSAIGSGDTLYSSQGAN